MFDSTRIIAERQFEMSHSLLESENQVFDMMLKLKNWTLPIFTAACKNLFNVMTDRRQWSCWLYPSVDWHDWSECGSGWRKPSQDLQTGHGIQLCRWNNRRPRSLRLHTGYLKTLYLCPNYSIHVLPEFQTIQFWTCSIFFRGPTPAIHFGTLWPDCWRPPLRSRKLATLPSPSCWTLETCISLMTGTLTSSILKCSGLDSSSLLHCQESSPPCPEGETSA